MTKEKFDQSEAGRHNEQLAYTIPAFSKAMGCGNSKTYQLIGDGRLKAVKIDGRTIITTPAAKEFRDSLPPMVPSGSTTA
jgi:hypothetical protein